MIPDPEGHEARHRRCHASCEALPAPTLSVKTTVVARATKTPACHLRCGDIGAAKLPLRSAAEYGVTLTLPLVAFIEAPLIEEADVVGDACVRPPPRASPGRAGAGRNAGQTMRARHRRTLRRNTGRIIYVNYATFSFPAHTRVAPGKKSPAPAVATLFLPSRNPTG